MHKLFIPIALFLAACSDSAERVGASEIKATADSLSGQFDHIDFCVDIAHERGDEYLSIIGNKVYDYSADNIYLLEDAK